MTGQIQYEDDYIVGGKTATRVTPNFTLGELTPPGRSPFIHRELVAALQELRDGYGNPVRITGLNARGESGRDLDGQFAWVSGADVDAMAAMAGRLVKDQFLQKVQRHGKDIYLQIPDPENLPPLPPASALERAVRVTAAYETSGDPYLQVTGNFDGAGLSFGPLQVNFKTGTLQELFGRFANVDVAVLQRCFTRDTDREQWNRVVRGSNKAAVTWADALSTGANKSGFSQPWKGYLQNVGIVEKFRRETLAYAYDVYGRKLIRALAWLHGLSPITINAFPCLAALYDLCVQQGSLDRAHDQIRSRVATERPDDQTKLVRIAVEERGKKADPAWRADCISRRLGILMREPVTFEYSGKTATRGNLRMHLLRNTTVNNMERYLA